MSAQPLLSRLQRVRQAGRDRWVASCPTRKDKRPSLSIRELPDGRVLMYDFGGASVAEILAAIDLDISALFPEKSFRNGFNHHRTERRPFNPYDVLACVALEAAFTLQVANKLRAGTPFSPEDHVRLVTACGNLVAAVDIARA